MPPFRPKNQERETEAPDEGFLDSLVDRVAETGPRNQMDEDDSFFQMQPQRAAGGDAMGGEYPALASQEPSEPEMPDNLAEEELEMPEEDPELRRRAMRAIYGQDFPMARDEGGEPEPSEWVDWAKGLWSDLEPGTTRIMHMVWRNRLFRLGVQWLSPTGSGPWREPPKPRDAVRAVHNMIAPALDQRVQILAEQRPGFRAKPVTQDPDDLKKAEAQQMALEYQYDQQHMGSVIREAAYWAGTDGCSFLMCYWDPDKGPWHEETEPQTGKSYKFPLGDICTKVFRIEQVRVSPNARANERPHYWVVRDVVPIATAVAMYGDGVVDENADPGDRVQDSSLYTSANRLGLEIPGIDELYEDQDVVDRYYVFCEPSEYLPDGLMVVAVGSVVVFAGSLIGGTVPMVRFTDGSTDPSFYPQPVMNQWIDHQIRTNTLISKWIESIRVNSGGRFALRSGSVATETLIGGLISAIEVRTAGPVNDALAPIQPFSVGNDVMEAVKFEISAFEQKSGWTPESRGNYTNEQSGRAILAIREQLERAFTPMVVCAAESMTEWGRINQRLMRWGYDLPRTIGVMGSSRVDLAREIQSEDFDGACDVFIDPETLMPMPRALKLFLLEQMYEKQQMSAQEYRRRLPFAWTQSLGSPDEVHEARARRIAEAIRQGKQVPEMLWQDDEAIHQDVLDREIILNDSLPEAVRRVAQERWVALANQSAMKAGAQAPAPSPGGGAAPPQGDQLPPESQPFLATSPGVASAPARQLTGTEGESASLNRMGPDYTQPF